MTNGQSQTAQNTLCLTLDSGACLMWPAALALANALTAEGAGGTPVSSVTPDHMKKQDYRNLPDVLHSVRAFCATANPGLNDIGTRRISIHFPGDVGGRLLIPGGGHQQNDSCHAAATQDR